MVYVKDNSVKVIIPARGGSKRIPKKNIKEIAGKPLIQWTIDFAKSELCVDSDGIFVSTDDVEIREVAEFCGSEVLDRPNKLATDDCHTIDVLKYHLDVIDNGGFVVLLQPTFPVRYKGLLVDAIGRYNYNGTLFTAKKITVYPFGNSLKQSQETNWVIAESTNIAIYSMRQVMGLYKYEQLVIPMFIDDWYTCDIDTDFDWVTTEAVLNYQKAGNINEFE